MTTPPAVKQAMFDELLKSKPMCVTCGRRITSRHRQIVRAWRPRGSNEAFRTESYHASHAPGRAFEEVLR